MCLNVADPPDKAMQLLANPLRRLSADEFAREAACEQ